MSAQLEGTSDLTPVTADALVAVATGSAEEPDLDAVAAYEEVQATYHAIAEQIRRTTLEREHIAGLRALLDARERELDDLADQRRRDENKYPASTSARRVGNGWLEVKWIPRASGNATGPYLYFSTVPAQAVQPTVATVPSKLCGPCATCAWGAACPCSMMDCSGYSEPQRAKWSVSFSRT